MLLREIFWPIVFLSWLPFISSNMILMESLRSGFQSDAVLNLMQVFPNYNANVAIGLALAGVASATTKRKPAHIVALLPYGSLIYAAVFIDPTIGFDTANVGQLSVVSFVVTASVLVSMVFFCFAGHITDSFFIPFYAIAFLDCLLASSGVTFAVFAPLLNHYTPSLVGVLLSLMSIFFLRSAVLAYRHNPDFRSQFKGELKPALWKTLGFWWPMLVFFAIMTGGYQYLQSHYVTPAAIDYLHNFEHYEDVALGKPEPRPVNPEAIADGATVRGELLAMIDRQAAWSRDQALASIEATKVAVTNGTIEAKNTASAEINGALPSRFPGTDQRHCSFWDIPCLLANGIKSMINTAYVRTRDRQLAELQATLNGMAASAEVTNEQIADQLSKQSIKKIDLIASISKTSVIQIVTALLLLGFVLAFYSLLVLIKSFLVVFARVIYATHTIAVNPVGNSPFGSVEAGSSEFEIPARSQRQYYARLNAIGNNVVDRKRIPYWYKLPLVRLIKGAYVMCYIDPSKHESSCFLQVDRTGTIAAWTMKPGEEVIFNFSDFVGISHDATLNSKISLNIASLIFGRIIYHYATGPGVLLLRTRDKAVVGWKGPANAALNTAGLVAWNARNEFNVVAWPSIADTFFSSVSLRKSKYDLIVFDQESARKKSGGLRGIWRLGRTFLLPF